MTTTRPMDPAAPSAGAGTFDVRAVRARFPALAREVGGRPAVFLDGPGGTQVPEAVIDAVAAYYRTSNANDGGAFATSEATVALIASAHRAAADFVGAASPEEVKFGANMTTLTFHISRSIAASLTPGDEIVVTTLDHEANVSPWRAVAADRGLLVRQVDIHTEDGTLDLDDLDARLGRRTKLVAVGWASNAMGTINPVAEIVRRAHAVGAWTYVDAVHFAPHGLLDVAAIDTDFLVTSAYKWFGPHAGVLYGRAELLERLPAYKVRPAHDRFETGTPNFEGLAGTLAAIGYLEDVGRQAGADDPALTRRQRLAAAMGAIGTYEQSLCRRLLGGLAAIPGVRVWGITDPARLRERTPTVAITVEGRRPRAVAAELGRQGIFVWDGDFYAQGLIERLGLADSGGVVRLGLVHYNTVEEVERTLEALEAIARG
jgi:cysteine desulfurase family protein (TIGR01976 family)